MDHDVASIEPITDSRIQKALRAIEKSVSLGNSLPVSKKNACGNDRSELARAVVAHPSYKPIQVEYMRQLHNKKRWVR